MGGGGGGGAGATRTATWGAAGAASCTWRAIKNARIAITTPCVTIAVQNDACERGDLMPFAIERKGTAEPATGRAEGISG